MSWAQRRKSTYILSFLFIIFLILIAVFFLFFNKRPTCFDGVKNQGETGIDCGGPCSILCRAEYSNPSIIWVRWAKVLSSGSYNLLAYAENPNIGVGAYDVPYMFKVYDKNNILLYSKNGSTYIPPNNNFVIFTDGIKINDKIPARIVFEFLNGYVWNKIENKDAVIVAISKSIIDENTKPKVLVTLKNKSFDLIKNIESVAVLYDENDNAVAFSRTIVDSLAGEESQNITFTWPEKFENKIYKIEIISKALPAH